MTKEQIVEKTLREMDMLPSSGQDSQASDNAKYIPIVIAKLQRRLPDSEIKTCEDFKHLNVACCELCHTYVPLDKMELIDLADGGKAWVCHPIEWAIFPERSREWPNSAVPARPSALILGGR